MSYFHTAKYIVYLPTSVIFFGMFYRFHNGGSFQK